MTPAVDVLPLGSLGGDFPPSEWFIDPLALRLLPSEEIPRVLETAAYLAEQFIEALAADDWVGMVISLVDRQRIPALAMCFWTGRLTAAQLNQSLAAAWSVAKHPWAPFGKRPVVDLFRAAGFVTDTPGVLAPTSALTVYRGCTQPGRRGLSWTVDLARAAWFARRLIGPEAIQHVYSATVPPQHVLGIFHERQEAEAVVDPSRLRHFRDVPRPEWPPVP